MRAFVKRPKPKERKTMARERATELEYLRWFKQNADFGPADSDIHEIMALEFMENTGKNIPKGWNFAQDGETVLDKD